MLVDFGDSGNSFQGRESCTVDVSRCTSLKALMGSWGMTCENAVFGTLPSLQNVDIESNYFRSNVDLSGVANLEDLRLSCTYLYGLTMGAVPSNLKYIGIENPGGLTGPDTIQFDLSNCGALEYAQLPCGDVEVRMGDNPLLKTLSCSFCDLTSLDLSGCPNLESLDCGYNNLTSLDLSRCPKLTDLDCQDNNLASLDVSGCSELGTLRCEGNNLTSLNVSGCLSLRTVICHYNDLTSLDISGCPSLKGLNCSQNRISDTSALEAWLAMPGHSGQVNPQKSDEESLAA